MGIIGHDDDVTDYSPDGVAARVDAAREALRDLDGTSPVDDVDRVTIAAMRERLGLQIELHDARLDVGDLNVIASPLQSMRDVFDLMATDTEEDWAADRQADVEGARPGRRLRRSIAGGGGGRARARGPAGRHGHRAGRPDSAAVCGHGGRGGAGKRCAACRTAPARGRGGRRLRRAHRGAARRDRAARSA